jgi:hypothetical protein
MQYDKRNMLGKVTTVSCVHPTTFSSPSCLAASKGVQPPQYHDQDPPPQNRAASRPSISPEHVTTLENIESSIQSPPLPLDGSSGIVPLSSRSVELPAHPWKPAPLAPGVDPKVPKTANRVYDSVVAGMLTDAQHRFECLLFVENAYPDISIQIRWSFESWEEVCSKYKNFFELSKEMMNLVRISHGHPRLLTVN